MQLIIDVDYFYFFDYLNNVIYFDHFNNLNYSNHFNCFNCFNYFDYIDYSNQLIILSSIYLITEVWPSSF